jgi:hypothetical protein
MIVLAFLTGPAVVEKILRHLGLPHAAMSRSPRLASTVPSNLLLPVSRRMARASS